MIRYIVSVFFSFFLVLGALNSNAYAKKWYDSFNLGGGITSILQTTASNKDTTDLDGAGAENNTDYAYTFDLGIEAELTKGHMLFVAFESGEGEGINDNFSTTIVPNYDPFNTHNTDVGHQDFTISQAFYEGFFFNSMVTLDIGKMDIHSLNDENNFAGDETTQFFSGILSRQAGTLFAELDNYYSPGVRLLLSPIKYLDLSYVFANSNNESLGNTPYNTFQANIKPGIPKLDGNYRFYLILDGRKYTNISDGTKDNNTAWGISFDQFITKDIGIFFRYGAQKDEFVENAITSTISGGIMVGGNFWNRGNDFFGIGYGLAIKNDKITTPYNDDQSIVELYYHYQVANSIAVTPDFQYHAKLPRINSRDLYVFGLRAQLDF